MSKHENQMQNLSRRARSTITLACFAALFACSTLPDETKRKTEALQGDVPSEFSARIETSFRKKISFLRKPDIEAYLTQIANRLFSPSRQPLRVELVSAPSGTIEPSVWAIPGGTVFFDIRVLRTLRFENEIAAALALAWQRSKGMEFRERMIEEAGKADPQPNELWKFGETENNRAIEASVERIYKAGYDPRGLVSYFSRMPNRATGANAEPLNEALKDKTRRTISFYAPLRNPIVRTEEFYRMRKRLDRL
jgi:predicted Zn-dependent protease